MTNGFTVSRTGETGVLWFRFEIKEIPDGAVFEAKKEIPVSTPH
jgi:hypothetical protein